MMRRIASGFLISLFLCTSASAQTLSDGFVQTLNEQGFVVESTGYTWLRRVIVKATNGVHDREIVISRGTEQIIQDNWRPASRPNGEVRETRPNDKPKPAAPNIGATGKQAPGKGGKGGPGGKGGHGGKGGK